MQARRLDLVKNTQTQKSEEYVMCGEREREREREREGGGGGEDASASCQPDVCRVMKKRDF